VDWREIDNLAEFLSAVRHSKLNQDCVLVAIVRDLLDLKQAFAAGSPPADSQTGLGGPDRTLLAGGLFRDGSPAA